LGRHLIEGDTHSNIIVFGESGAGKSSVVNMLGDERGIQAAVADQAEGVTFEYKKYVKTIKKSEFNIFDTVGLNEGMEGRISADRAIQELHNLLYEISKKGGGISLLVFVMRAPRIRAMTQKNYQMFYENLCDKSVRIVLVVTGLEHRENMDSWWDENKEVFKRYGMVFEGNACITATRGKQRRDGGCAYDEEYGASKMKVEDLILRNATESWKMPTHDGLVEFVFKVINRVLKAFGRDPMEPERLRLAKETMNTTE